MCLFDASVLCSVVDLHHPPFLSVPASDCKPYRTTLVSSQYKQKYVNRPSSQIAQSKRTAHQMYYLDLGHGRPTFADAT